MLLKLSLLLSTIGIIACNVPFDITKEVKYEETNQIYQRNYQHSEYLNSYTEVVYKYETNEVNSVDDLVQGNIYSINYPVSIIPSTQEIFAAYAVIDFKISNSEVSMDRIDGTYIRCTFGTSSGYFYDGNIFYSFSYSSTNIDYISFYFVFYEVTGATPNYIQYISSTDYNEIESVIYHQPQTIIGYFNEFLEENLFSEIPFVREMTFNIGGQNINLLTYLIIAFGLVVSVGLLIGLFLLLKWLFKVFANSFILR